MRGAVDGLAPSRPARAYQSRNVRSAIRLGATSARMSSSPLHVRVAAFHAACRPRLPVVVRDDDRLVEHQRRHPLGVHRRVPRADAEAVPGHQHDVAGPRRVHDGGEIVGPLVDDRALPVRDRVRQTQPAPVEDDHTTERTQAVEQTSEPGLLLEQLERDQPTRHHHDVAGRLGGRVRVEHPVRDVRPVVGSGVEDVDHDLESRETSRRSG